MTRAATPELVVMAETGRFPLALFIARQVYATWRRLDALDDDDRWVARAALRDSEALIAKGGSSWAGAVREMMTTLAVTGAESPVELEERLRREYAARLSAADGTKTAFYRDAVRGWSGGVDLKAWSAPEYMRAALPVGRRAALARLRCASHFLQVETGRRTPVARPLRGGAAAPRRVQPARSASAAARASLSQESAGASPSPPAGRPARVRLKHAQRVCRLCGSGEVEDETHMILRCPFSRLASLQALHPNLFSLFPQPLEADALRRFLEQQPALVADFMCSAFSRGAYDKISLD